MSPNSDDLREQIERIQAERDAMPEAERIRREAADAPLLRIQLAHFAGENERLKDELEKADAAELKRTRALLKMAERHAMNCDANQAAAEAGQARAESRHAGLNAHHLRAVADHRAELDAMRERAENAEADLDQTQRASQILEDQLAEVRAERGALEAAVRKCHPRDDSNPRGPWCPTCLTVWPCSTAAALAASEGPTDAPVRSHLFGGGR